MTDPPINIDSALQGRARKLEDIIAYLKNTQIIECSECAKASSIQRLDRCLEALREAVSTLQSVQGDRI